MPDDTASLKVEVGAGVLIWLYALAEEQGITVAEAASETLSRTYELCSDEDYRRMRKA